jgi:endonuclease/exonuclease/phosphatase family metal-dependent hydrolase
MLRALLLALLAFSAAASAHARDVKVVTYNTALLSFALGSLEKEFDEKIPERRAALPAQLQATGADVILLQEVWTLESRDLLIEGFRSVGYDQFAYSDRNPFHRPVKGRFGNGLLTVSRLPIVEQQFQHFTANTRPKEYPLAKGVLRARVQVGAALVDVYNTHLGAMSMYRKDPTVYTAHAVKGHRRQMLTLVKFLERDAGQPGAVPRLIGGDFNQHFNVWNRKTHRYIPRKSRFYRQLTEALGLRDAYAATHGGELPVEGFEKTFHKVGPKDRPETLDYLFADAALRPVATELLFREPVEVGSGKAMLSDHYAVAATFEVAGS